MHLRRTSKAKEDASIRELPGQECSMDEGGYLSVNRIGGGKKTHEEDHGID